MNKFKFLRQILPEDKTWKDTIIDGFSHSYKSMKKAIVCDCDGILTDGNLSYTKDGKFMKTYGCHDKEMINVMKSLGWEFYFVSNDRSGFEITKQRVNAQLKYECYQEGPIARANRVKNLVNNGYIVVFCGDSPSDLLAAKNAHCSCTTKNCFDPIKRYFNYVSDKEGGHGGLADILYQLILIGEDGLKIVKT